MNNELRDKNPIEDWSDVWNEMFENETPIKWYQKLFRQRYFIYKDFEFSFFNSPFKFFLGCEYGKVFIENNLFAICYTYSNSTKYLRFKIGFEKEFGFTIFLGTFQFTKYSRHNYSLFQ